MCVNLRKILDDTCSQYRRKGDARKARSGDLNEKGHLQPNYRDNAPNKIIGACSSAMKFTLMEVAKTASATKNAISQR